MSLDNPVYDALATDQASLAMTNGRARRFPRAVAPFAAVDEPTPEAFAELRELVEPDEGVAVLTPAPPPVPEGWHRARGFWVDQMVLEGEPWPGAADLVELGRDDVPEMLALARLTQPGPFQERTIDLGRYVGIRRDGRLAAMAGERMRPHGHTELSAVCTHPDFTGRGYARGLMGTLIADALAAGRRPMLHVMAGNPARGLYEKLGFGVRTRLHISVLTPAR
jgi:ribosomal protein S18 acetylase RimI-like enzyme